VKKVGREMVVSVSCPRCGQLVDPQERRCNHCGVDLARAAVFAEQILTSSNALLPNVPITPEILVPRIGEYLIDRGVLDTESLDRALEYHQELSDSGQPRLLGQVLLELGLIDRETLDQVITEQIFQLHSALELSNRQLEQRVQERTRELQQALTKLAELNQLKSNFVSNVSHELRTPLTHIKGYLDLLADGTLGTLSEEQVDTIKILRKAENRLEELIEELIQFSLAASDQFTLRLERVNLHQLIESIVTQSLEKAKKRSVNIAKYINENQLMVNADKEKISWVLLELLDNAIKFTPEGGTVRLETGYDNGMVLVSVSDTGIGIPDDRIVDIFEPFHQLDSSVTRRYGGVGLGLSLVRKIIEAHGTSIKVESKIGAGSRFDFYLLPMVI
jgi:signal transduction histidine kinase